MNQPNPTTTAAADDEGARNALRALRTEISKAVVGQDAVVSGLVIALLCRGHVLLEGVPGLQDLARPHPCGGAATGVKRAVHSRPDARRRDGLAGLRCPHRRIRVPLGPGVHNRFSPTDQPNPAEDPGRTAEAMEERQVSVDGEARPLPDPFIVAATQNPIEYEAPTSCRSAAGPLPAEAQRATAAAGSGDGDPARHARVRSA